MRLFVEGVTRGQMEEQYYEGNITYIIVYHRCVCSSFHLM